MPAASASFTGPRYYDEQLVPVNFGPFARALVSRLPEGLRGRVLEIACGTGAVTLLLRDRLHPSAELVATDLSPAMLDYARTHLADVPGIEWREADAQQLPFEDGRFAAVVCGFGFMFAPDREAAFREARRVLEPGGGLFFTVWDAIEENPHALANAEVIESLFPGDPEMKFRLPYDMHDERGLRDLLQRCGFSGVQVDTVRVPLQGVDPGALASGQIRGTPRSALLVQRGAVLEEVIAAIAAALERQGGNPYSGHAQAKLVEARAA